MLKKNSINKQSIICFMLFLYFIAISAFQLGTGFDAFFVRITFALLVLVTIFSSKNIIINKQIKWVCVFWVYYFLSVIWAKNSNDTFYYFNNFIQIVGISFVLPLIAKKEEDIVKIIKIFLLSMLFTTILLIIRTPSSAWGTERLGETIGLGPNGTGIRLAIASIFSIYLFHDNINKKSKKAIIIFYLFLFIIFSTVLLFTGSKKALFICVFGFISFELIKSKGIEIFSKIIIVFLIILSLYNLVITNDKLYSVLGKRTENMIYTIINPNRENRVDYSLVERLYYTEKAKELFINHPIIGYGGNNFVTYMRELSYPHVAYSHNNYYELLSTLGLFGFVLYYFLWIDILIKYIIAYFKTKKIEMLLFSIVLISLIFTDIGNVSYIIEFNNIILIISYLYLYFCERGKVLNEKNN